MRSISKLLSPQYEDDAYLIVADVEPSSFLTQLATKSRSTYETIPWNTELGLRSVFAGKIGIYCCFVELAAVFANEFDILTEISLDAQCNVFAISNEPNVSSYFFHAQRGTLVTLSKSGTHLGKPLVLPHTLNDFCGISDLQENSIWEMMDRHAFCSQEFRKDFDFSKLVQLDWRLNGAYLMQKGGAIRASAANHARLYNCEDPPAAVIQTRIRRDSEG